MVRMELPRAREGGMGSLLGKNNHHVVIEGGFASFVAPDVHAVFEGPQAESHAQLSAVALGVPYAASHLEIDDVVSIPLGHGNHLLVKHAHTPEGLNQFDDALTRR